MKTEIPIYPRPTKAELEAARQKTVADVIKPGLKVLFAGINPGLYTAAIGHHFGRLGNKFWPALYAGGFTPRLLSPYEEQELLKWGYGISNVVQRTTASADEVSDEEYREGGRVLEQKVIRYKPKILAILGVGAYRVAFKRPTAVLGLQKETMGSSKIWILPNPSGLNAHYQAADMARLFQQLRKAGDPS